MLSNDTIYCYDAPRKPLEAKPAGGGSIVWYRDYTLTTEMAQGDTCNISSLGVGKNVISATERGGECESKPVRVTVTVLPKINTGVPAINEGCLNTDITIRARQDASVAYTWLKDGVEIGKGDTVVVTVTEEAEVYTVHAVKDNNGVVCATDYDFKVRPSTFVPVIDTTVCQGDSIDITVAGGVKYLWPDSSTASTYRVRAGKPNSVQSVSVRVELEGG